MKLYLLTSCVLAATGVASPVPAEDTTNGWTRVPLANPANWVAGPKLFPGEVLYGYHADYYQYNSESWAAHVLNTCKGYKGVASTNSFSAINSGTPKTRDWFGYCYLGNATTPADYVRQKGVQGSVAYTCG